MKIPFIAALFAIPLAACGQSASTGQATKSDVMSNIAMSGESKQANGVGTITAIDAATGQITLDHGPVAELKWPAMTMTFAGNAAMAQGLAVGDKVAFSFQWDGQAGRLTSIRKE